jgi:hypothetical protein
MTIGGNTRRRVNGTTLGNLGPTGRLVLEIGEWWQTKGVPIVKRWIPADIV